MKTKLIEAAKQFGFESTMLYGKPYKHSSNEDLRYYLWLEEFARKIFDVESFYIEITSIPSFPYFRYQIIKFNENTSLNILSPEDITSQLFKTKVEAMESAILKFFEI